MNNREAYKFSKVLVRTLVECNSDKKQFETWLTLQNPLLDNRAPADFLNTISGIQFIDSRLTAMEFGENV